MSVGKDLTFGPRLKWFRQAIGEPWCYAAHDGRSGRAFYIAIGLKHPNKGFTREIGSFKPDVHELIDMAKTMGYPADQQQDVGYWLHNGLGPEPSAPPGITKKPLPLPKEAVPATHGKPVAAAAPVAPGVEPAEVMHLKEIASDLILEAAETGEKLPAKVLELVRAVKALGASMRKPLAALLVGLGLLGEADAASYSQGILTPVGSDEEDEIEEIGTSKKRNARRSRKATRLVTRLA